MNTKNQKLYDLIYKIDSNFCLTVIRRSLTMMIPLLIVGGVSCALTNLPFIDYKAEVFNGFLGILCSVLKSIYNGTFGLFSLVLLICVTLSYCIEKNKTIDKTAIYIIVVLAAFGTQLNIGTPEFSFSQFGVQGCFSALFTAFISCYLYEKFREIEILTFKKNVMGMDSICANALSSIFPMVFVVLFSVMINLILYFLFKVSSVHALFSKFLCYIFKNIQNDFLKGFLYTFLLHFFWALGFHGSHLLEPVVDSVFTNISSDLIFSKSFFDTYIVMGGCGTTICVFLIYLIFYRKTRFANISKIAFIPVIFNINEVLTFGIPIILNPILVIPFILTPVALYVIAYISTALNIVPHFITAVPWSTPIFFNGYLGTGSLKAVLLQIFLICIGMLIYFPFIKINKKVQDEHSHTRLNNLVEILKQNELDNESPQFLTRTDNYGIMARLLLEDLKNAIKNNELYMLYQPQISYEGKCIGAEALLRWNHSFYGNIYPPLIIYLAKEGGILPELEAKIIDSVTKACRDTAREYKGDFKISFNITGKSLCWDIESFIEEKVKKYSIPEERLWIEITEQDVISKNDVSVATLNRLKEKGHTLLIDDFGMGHTLLLYLQSGYFAVVKLDGSLVKDIVKSKATQNIVKSVIELGNRMGIKVIAEFVESKEQVEVLHSLGCNNYQGYLYSKPIPLENFISYIIENNS